MENETSQKSKSFSPKRYQLAIVALVVVLIFSIAGIGGAYYYLSNVYTKPAEEKVAPIIEVTKDPELSKDEFYISSSRYESEISDKSKIDKEETGKLYEIKHDASGIRFMTAVGPNGSIALNPGWSIKKLGEDAMWIPGACAQKPSWMAGSHYIMVDDGTYSEGKSMHYYALYDTNVQKYKYFGGSLISEAQSEENIMFVNVEEGNIVFYIDLKDPTGIFKDSTNFKHATKNRENYIIRRVINPETLEYVDYKVPYTAPDYSVYFMDVAKSGEKVQLLLNTDGHKDYLIGDITPNTTVNLKKVSSDAYFSAQPTPSTPFGSHRTAMLNSLRKLSVFSWWSEDPGDVFRYFTENEQYIGFNVDRAPAVFNKSTGVASYSITEAGQDAIILAEPFTLGAFK